MKSGGSFGSRAAIALREDAVSADPPRGFFASPVKPRILFYAILTVLAACGAFQVTLVLGFFFMIVPGLVFMAAPYLWLYLPILDWPSAAWRATRRADLAALWLGLALIIPCGVPLAVNLSIDLTAARGRTHQSWYELEQTEGTHLAWPLGVHFQMKDFNGLFGMHLNHVPLRDRLGLAGLDMAAIQAEFEAMERERPAAERKRRALCEAQRRQVLDHIAKWQAYRYTHRSDEPSLTPSYEEEHPPKPCD